MKTAWDFIEISARLSDTCLAKRVPSLSRSFPDTQNSFLINESKRREQRKLRVENSEIQTMIPDFGRNEIESLIGRHTRHRRLDCEGNLRYPSILSQSLPSQSAAVSSHCFLRVMALTILCGFCYSVASSTGEVESRRSETEKGRASQSEVLSVWRLLWSSRSEPGNLHSSLG